MFTEQMFVGCALDGAHHLAGPREGSLLATPSAGRRKVGSQNPHLLPSVVPVMSRHPFPEQQKRSLESAAPMCWFSKEVSLVCPQFAAGQHSSGCGALRWL